MYTEIFARFISGSRYEMLDTASLAGARRGIVDALGVSIAGSAEDVAGIVLAHARRTGATGRASAICGGLRTTPALASWINGTLAHALDYDDVIHAPPFWMGHPSVAILPAALAVAEATGASGRDLILAYAVGVEVYARLGLICGDSAYQAGWHNTCYIGTMAAAAAASRLLRLDIEQTRRALGIAGSLAGGLRQNFGTMTKPLHAGIAARSGVEAAELAQAGLTADPGIIEGPLGFRRVFTGERRDMSRAIPYGHGEKTPEELAALMGAPWAIGHPGLSFKICPSCRATHFGMEAGLLLRTAHPGAQVARVEAHVPDHMASVLFYHDPDRGLEGKFSLEYVLSRTLLDGVPKIADFTDARVNEPAIRAMNRRVEWLPFTPQAGEFGIPRFVFHLTDGRRFETEVEYPRGEPENPVTDAVLWEKFHDCAGLVLDTPQRREILACAEGLEAATSLAPLMGVLRDRRAAA